MPRSKARVTVLTKVVAFLRESGLELELPELAGRFPHIPRETVASALSRAKAQGLLRNMPLPVPFGRRGKWRYCEAS